MASCRQPLQETLPPRGALGGVLGGLPTSTIPLTGARMGVPSKILFSPEPGKRWAGGEAMIVADVSVVPIGEGTSVGRFVRRAVEALEASGLRVMPGPMSTSVEAHTLDELFAAVRMAHEAVVGAGAKRVLTTIKIDERLDREHTMASKLEAIR